jgi:hypothetical protein
MLAATARHAERRAGDRQRPWRAFAPRRRPVFRASTTAQESGASPSRLARSTDPSGCRSGGRSSLWRRPGKGADRGLCRAPDRLGRVQRAQHGQPVDHAIQAADRGLVGAPQVAVAGRAAQLLEPAQHSLDFGPLVLRRWRGRRAGRLGSTDWHVSCVPAASNAVRRTGRRSAPP